MIFFVVTWNIEGMQMHGPYTSREIALGNAGEIASDFAEAPDAGEHFYGIVGPVPFESITVN